MMKTLKGWIWLNVIGMFAYLMVILAMLYGWGLKPVSWLWMILFYFIAENSWFILVSIRMWMEDHWKAKEGGKGC